MIFHSDPKPIWFLLSSLPLFHLPLLTASALLNSFSSLHLTVHPSHHLLLHVHSPPYVADKYEIKKVPTSLLFIAMPHQRRRNCLYEHASSIPVQNKTNQFSQKVKLSSPRCHEGTGCYRVPAIGPAEDHHSSVVPAGSLSAWVHKTGVSEGPLTMLLHSRGFSFPSESGFF